MIEVVRGLAARLHFHEFTAWYVTQLSEETRSGRCFRAWLVLVTLGLGFVLLMAGQAYRRSIHTGFWLGLLPLGALLTNMIALASSFGIIVRVRVVQYFRHHRFKSAKLSVNNRGEARACCEPTPGSLRFLLLLVSVIAVGAIVLGALVLAEGGEVVNVMDTNCGKRGLSKELDEVQSKLVDFQTKCHAKAENKKTLVHNCDGFRKEFPEPQPYVDYLAQIEASEHCTGFCSKPPTRLFTAAAARPAGSPPEPACVEIVQHEVSLASALMGALPIVLGSLLFMKACLLFNFDHL